MRNARSASIGRRLRRSTHGILEVAAMGGRVGMTRFRPRKWLNCLSFWEAGDLFFAAFRSETRTPPSCLPAGCTSPSRCSVRCAVSLPARRADCRRCGEPHRRGAALTLRDDARVLDALELRGPFGPRTGDLRRHRRHQSRAPGVEHRLLGEPGWNRPERSKEVQHGSSPRGHRLALVCRAPSVVEGPRHEA